MFTNPAPIPPTPPGTPFSLDTGYSQITQGLPAAGGDQDFSGIPSAGMLPGGVPLTVAAQPAPTPSLPNPITITPWATSNSLNFNNTTGVGVASQPTSQPVAPQPPVEEQVYQSYSGSDMRVVLTLADPTGLGQSLTKQLVELTTLTVSIHRVKSPARACGYINPRGFARHGRTIAGTIILTQFTLDVMARFLYSQQSTDLSKDSIYVKCDQLPPFDLTLTFCDEFGNSSIRHLLGVDVVDDGTIYSSNDMFAEQTLSYMAADFTPLIPYNTAPLRMATDPNSSAASNQKTPMMVMPVPSQAEQSMVNPQTAPPPTTNPTTTATPIYSPGAEDNTVYSMPYEGD